MATEKSCLLKNQSRFCASAFIPAGHPYGVIDSLGSVCSGISFAMCGLDEEWLFLSDDLQEAVRYITARPVIVSQDHSTVMCWPRPTSVGSSLCSEALFCTGFTVLALPFPSALWSSSIGTYSLDKLKHLFVCSYTHFWSD